MFRSIKHLILLFFMMLSLTACAGTGDTLYTNGIFYTVDKEHPYAEAMVVKGSEIEYIGKAEKAKKHLAKKGKIIDLQGKFVMPAMIDSHTHPGLVALTGELPEKGKFKPELLPNESKEALYSYLRQYAKDHPELPAIALGSWDVKLFAPTGPNKAELDKIFPQRPVILFDNSGHSYWVNSAMLKALGINEDSPDLKKNLSYFVRDKNGKLTGWIKEFALVPFLGTVIKRDPKEIKERLLIYLDFLRDRGITTLQDAGNFGFSDGIYKILSEIDKEGKLPQRYEACYHIYSPAQIKVAVKELLRMRKAYGSKNLTFNTIKIHLDGVLEISTAAMLEPYSNDQTNKGGILFNAKELANFMIELAKKGIHLHIHSVGDRSTRTVLDAVELARKTYGGKLPIEVTLAHLEMVNKADMKRFKELGVNANFTPHWLGGTIFSGGNITVGEERYKHSQQVKSFINVGANVTFSSDVVALSSYLRANPFLGIELGVTRREPETPDAKIFGLESERATVADMIQGYTLNNAIQMGVSKELGSLQKGKLADFIVLPVNPLKIKVSEIHKIIPDAVYKAGKLIATPNSAPLEVADRVLYNGNFYTMNPNEKHAQAVAIKNKRFIFVGSNENVKRYIGDSTEVIDLKGYFVLPGFIDTHAHYALAGLMSNVLILNPTEGPEEWSKQIKAFAEAHPELPAILGLNIVPLKFGKNGPTREALDQLIPNRPALIIDDGGHTAWANSKTYELAGITKDTPDPVPGVHMYKRKANGEPSGWNQEAMTIYPLIQRLPFISKKLALKNMVYILNMLPAAGLTTYYDAGMNQMEDISYPILSTLEKEGKLPVKIVGSYIIQSPIQITGAVEKIKELRKEYHSELIDPSTVKIHNDGTLEAETAALIKDYSDSPGNKGGILLEGNSLKQFVTELAKNNINIHIHAIGDKTVKESLDAIEFAEKNVPNTKSRFAIAHVILSSPEEVKRFAKLNVVAQTTPIWIGTELPINPALGEERSKQRYLFNTIHKTGGKVSFGSDFPVSGNEGALPLYNMEVGMTRHAINAKDKTPLPPANEALPLEVMIKGYTIDAAYQLNKEKEIGSIEVGKYADLVVLNKDLFTLKPEQIHTAQVEMTLMNGKTTYQAPTKENK